VAQRNCGGGRGGKRLEKGDGGANWCKINGSLPGR
jgi:hypothetical protein